MKKIFLTLAFGLIAFSAFAKVDNYVTAGIGYKFQDTIINGSATPESSIDFITLTDQMYFESNLGMFWNFRFGLTPVSGFPQTPDWMTSVSARVIADSSFDTGFAVRCPTGERSFFAFGIGAFVNATRASYYGKGINPDYVTATEKPAASVISVFNAGPMVQLSYVLMPNSRFTVKFDLAGKYSLCRVEIKNKFYTKENESNIDKSRLADVSIFDCSQYAAFSIEPSLTFGIKF